MKRKYKKTKKGHTRINATNKRRKRTRRQRGGAYIENIDLQDTITYPIDRREYHIIERNPDASTPYEFNGRAVAIVVQPPQSADLQFPPSPKVSYRWVNGTLKTFNPDGSIDVYEGFFDDRKKHGHGKQTWSNGTIYEGNWENNVISGDGKLTDPLPLGEVMYIPTYQGNFENNQKSGHGTMIYADGSVYTGDWQNDTMHGNGRMQYKDGDIYVGSWVNGIKHGKGKQSYHDDPDVIEYEGDFENEELHGKGNMKFRNGSRYVGDWEHGNMHGHGKFYDQKGTMIYDGPVANNGPVQEEEEEPTFANNPANIFQNQQQPSGNIFGSRPPFF